MADRSEDKLMNTTDEVTRLKKAVAKRDRAYEKAREASHELWDLVDNSSLNITDIAQALGVTRGAVYSWKRQRAQDRK